MTKQKLEELIHEQLRLIRNNVGMGIIDMQEPLEKGLFGIINSNYHPKSESIPKTEVEKFIKDNKMDDEGHEHYCGTDYGCKHYPITFENHRLLNKLNQLKG